MEDDAKKVAKKLKELSSEKGWSQKELARNADLTTSAVSRYFNGTRMPNAKALSNMAAALGTSTATLLGSTTIQTSAMLSAFKGAGLATIMSVFTPAIASTAFVLGTLSSLSSSKLNIEIIKEKHDAEKIAETKLKVHKYIVFLTGIITSKVLENGWNFSVIPRKEDDVDSPDLMLKINDSKIEKWGFIFWDKDLLGKNEKQENSEFIARYLVSKFVFTKPDVGVKYSIVVNDNTLYEMICSNKGKLALKVNLSVALADIDNAKIKKETSISYYDENSYMDMVMLIHE